MNQRHPGDAVKKVLDMTPPALPEVEDAHDRQRHRPQRGPEGRPLEIARRQPWIRREAVDLRLDNQEVEGVEPAEHGFVGSVGIRATLPGLVELAHRARGHLLQVRDRAEVDGLGRARLGARRLEAHLHPVVAERALLRGARHRVDADHPERARADAVPAAVARVRLDDDRVELGADDGAGRAHLEAAGVRAVLADVAHHEPASVLPVGAELLDELHVPPVGAVERAGVVVAVAAQHADTPVPRRELVPLLARHLARLAADADGGVGVEAHRLRHHAFSTLHTKALASWIDTLGSPTRAVSSLAASPTTSPWWPQGHAMPRWQPPRPPVL